MSKNNSNLQSHSCSSNQSKSVELNTRVLTNTEKQLASKQLRIFELKLDIEADEGCISRLKEDLSDCEDHLFNFCNQLKKWKSGSYTVSDQDYSIEEKRAFIDRKITYLSVGITRQLRKKYETQQTIISVKNSLSVIRAEVSVLEDQINSLLHTEFRSAEREE